MTVLASQATTATPSESLRTWSFGFRIAAAALFIFGAWLRWKDGVIAITTPDSLEYFFHALKGDPAEVHWRNFLYPLFLKLCIEHLGGIGAIVVIQKIAGLCTAGLVFWAWMKIKRIMTYQPLGSVVHDLLGLLILAMLLLAYGSTRYFEQSIMIEALSSLALAAIVFAGISLFVSLWAPHRPAMIATWAATLIGLSLFANHFNSRFGPTVLLAFAAAFVVLHKAHVGIRLRLGAFCLPLVAAFLLLFLPQARIDRSKINPWKSTLVPMHFFFVQARLVLPELVHDAADATFTRYDRAFLREMSELVSAELERANREGSGGNFTLNFDPNRLIWGKAAFRLRDHMQQAERLNEFCTYYFRKGITRHPIGYATKIFREWIYLLRPGGPLVDDSWAALPLSTALAPCREYAALFVSEASPATLPTFLAYQKQITQPPVGGSFSTPFPFNRIGNWINRLFSLGGIALLGFSVYTLRKPELSARWGNACWIFLGCSLVLFAQLAPIALFTTTCGGRAIQGLRVLFTLQVASMGLLGCIATAWFAKRINLLFPTVRAGSERQSAPPVA